MSESCDIFFSYRRADLARAQALLDALDVAGLRVWRDTTDLPDNAAITPEIRRGLAASKVLVALYSSSYPLSRPCQQEITAAWLTAQLMGEQPYERVLAINPETTFDHLPKLLAEQQSMGWARTDGAFAALAGKIRGHVSSLKTTLAGAAAPVMPHYHGMAPVGAPRFVGRVRAMWDLHGQLTANRMSIVTGVFGQAAAQVRGLGGNGKSLLAREYAILFGAAYPGGVFWLNAYGNDDTKGPLDAQSREALRQDQVQGFAVRVGVQVEGLTPEQLESAFWRKLAENRQPFLWIVDDLPSGLEREEIERRWNAQWGGASTLITTRGTEYGAFGSHLDLEVLNDTESWQLLTGHRVPEGSAEEEAARGIAAELGNHPLAIEVAGSFLAKGIQSFRQYLDELGKPDKDALEFGAELRESLPTGHERSISGTLLKSMRLLGEEGMDFLRLASVLAVDAIPVRLVAAAFGRVDSHAQDGRRVLRALDQADSLGLCAKQGDDARIVHTLVSRTIRYRTGKDERTALLRLAAAQGLSSLLEVVADIRRHPEVAREMLHARHILSGGISSLEEAKVAEWVGRHDYERGSYSGARKLFDQVLEARRRLLGEEHPDTLWAMNNLAQTRQAQGDLAGARKLQEQVLEA
ncbi:MAG: toll/interleukin-1 receptor domain-containing protein, partial [Bryobacteraceae bacterium]